MIRDIRAELFRLQDLQYRDFQSRLIPTVDSEHFIGVRTPELRKLAKQISRRADLDEFMTSLPHQTFDENQLHAFVISGMKDYEDCLRALDSFLPYVDNWATCDQMSPAVFRKHRQELPEAVSRWIASGETYTIRFAVKTLMDHFLGECFEPVWPETVAAIRSEEYYVQMMVAWYFATALAKQYEAVLPFLEENRLDAPIHDMTIRKAVESCRISPEQKAYLRSLRRKGRAGVHAENGTSHIAPPGRQRCGESP
ncbi:MAG: DNA alkylation repair protein [Oscillospiraceae bacterium]|nr:DNA alkylation repair protein [Oscillospiraceae bacterium]